MTWKLQYKKGKDWVDVDFDTSVQEAAKTGKLILDYSPTEYLDDPKYYTHFTISKIVYGRTWIMNFEEGQLDMGGGATWANTFKKGATLDEGTYLLVTGHEWLTEVSWHTHSSLPLNQERQPDKSSM